MPPLLLASLTDKIVDPIVNVATDFIGSAGVVGVFVLMALESACIPVPSEAIMLFAGFSVSEGEMTLFGIVAAGVLGNLVGSWIAYGVGYFARLDLLERNRLIHVSPKHLKWADDWFGRYGDATVFFTRMLPIIRTFISLPAGVAKMPFWRFTAFTLAGCVPWVLMLALIGRSVGDNWEEWRHNLGYLDYVVLAAIVGGAVYLLVRRRRRGDEESAGEGGEPARAESGGGSGASAEPAGTAESL
jgi:membrane protein DedA with SNARE-associated domain